MRWLSGLSAVTFLAISSPAFSSTCDAVSANVGRALPFGLAVAQNPHQVFCQMKRTAPQTIYSFEYNGGSCGGIDLGNFGWKTSEYQSLEVLFNKGQAALQKRLSQIDKSVRSLRAFCYELGESVTRLVDAVRDAEPIDHRLTLLELTLWFHNFEFLGIKGTLQPIFAVNNFGLAALINNLQRNNKESIIQVNGIQYSVAASIVGAEFTTPPLKDPIQLTQMRREALPFFKRVLEEFPGEISQESRFLGGTLQNNTDFADLVITRSFYAIVMSFNESTGVIRMAIRLNTGLTPADYLSDEETIDRVNWLSTHLVRSR